MQKKNLIANGQKLRLKSSGEIWLKRNILVTTLNWWQNVIVTVVALYDKPQSLPLPDMYGKNLIFKTGGVDGCDCDEILSLIKQGKIDTTPLITHRFALKDIEKAYEIFENKLDGVIKIAVTTE